MNEYWEMKKVLRALENKDSGTINSLIVKHSINPNAIIASKGVSLMHLIIGHQSESFAFRITKLFLRCGGDPNVLSSDKVTPVHVAAAWGRTHILHLLLVNGGNPWLQDEEKKNAFNYAFEAKEWDTITMLHHFQKMYSATNFKQEIDHRFQLDFERVVLRKGEEEFSYSSTPPKCTKSMTTQTQSDIIEKSPSPIQEKIKLFEPKQIATLEINCWKKPEKLDVGWVKDFYQTTGEIVVHCDASIETDNKPEEKNTFISSIHIDTSPATQAEKDSDVEKEVQEQTPKSCRGQLLIELQEAVRRRSMLKSGHQDAQLNLKKSEISVTSDPIKHVNNDISENDSFMAKEVSYLYGINLRENGMLKNMSDFATKVMNEIEVTESDPVLDKTIDLCKSSSELKNSFLSCEDEPCENFDKNIPTFLIPQNNSDSLYMTPYNSNLSSEVIMNKSKEENSNESFVSVSEEYKYTDVQEGVVLLEKKLLVTPTISFALEDGENIEEMIDRNNVDPSEISSTVSSIPSTCDSDILRWELKGFGYNPGPITKTTKTLYLKKLKRLKKKAKRNSVPNVIKPYFSSAHSSRLTKTLTNLKYFEQIPKYGTLEEEMRLSFENWTKRKWREGTNKTSFNYLLLDSRVSLNLPKRALGMNALDVWNCFLSAVFYVGKGKRSRPYSHLYQAATLWENGRTENLPPDDKTETILEIWKEGLGVVCLHVFQNIIPVEALTREAAMIESLGLSNLKNVRIGEYYGVASTWPTRDKINLGIYLLHKAMQIFLNEGERQIKPYDLD